MRSKGISTKDCKRIEKALEEPYRGVWRISYEYGLRISDIVRIKASDVDEKGYLHYVAVKTGKPARVKLSQEVLEKYFSRHCGEVPVFMSPRIFGQAVSRQAVWKHIKLACKRLRIKADGVSPHSGRKHFAQEMYRTAGLGATMAALQHSSPAVTYLYCFDENPFKSYDSRIKSLEKRLKVAEKLLKKYERIIEGLADRVYGDDCYRLAEQ